MFDQYIYVCVCERSVCVVNLEGGWKFLWHKLVPLNVIMFIWMVVKDRIPVKIIYIAEGFWGLRNVFVWGVGKRGKPLSIYSITALSFLRYGRVLWAGWELYLLILIRYGCIFFNFDGLLGSFGIKKHEGQAIWFAVMWGIRKTRNDVLVLVEGRKKGYIYPLVNWLSGPVSCLGSNKVRLVGQRFGSEVWCGVDVTNCVVVLTTLFMVLLLFVVFSGVSGLDILVQCFHEVIWHYVAATMMGFYFILTLYLGWWARDPGGYIGILGGGLCKKFKGA